MNSYCYSKDQEIKKSTFNSSSSINRMRLWLRSFLKRKLWYSLYRQLFALSVLHSKSIRKNLRVTSKPVKTLRAYRYSHKTTVSVKYCSKVWVVPQWENLTKMKMWYYLIVKQRMTYIRNMKVHYWTLMTVMSKKQLKTKTCRTT